MLKKLGVLLSISLFTVSVYAENPDVALPPAENLVETLKASAKKDPLEFLTSNSITFDAEKIQWLLQKDGYKLDDYDNIEQKLDEGSNFSSVVIKSPLSISTGCGTVEANLDEALALMVAAFKQQLAKMPAYFMQEVLGLPDTNNPKEVFEYIYDTTTTLVCGGEAGVVQAMETATYGSMAYIKSYLNTKSDESTETASGTQIGHGCALAARQDEQKTKTNEGGNQNADEQAEGATGNNLIKGHSEKFNQCKQKYTEYKSYIEARIKKFDIYRKREKELRNSSCSVLAKQSGVGRNDAVDQFMSEFAHLPNPLAMGNHAEDDAIITAKSNLSSQNIRFGSEGVQTEILVNKQAIIDDLVLEGQLKKYSNSNQKINDRIFRIGRNYLNTITECLNQYTSLAKNPLCEKIDRLGSPYPVKLYDEDRQGMIVMLETKKMLCDATLFGVDDDQYIVDSIGYVTHLLGIEQNYTGSRPSIADLKTATETMVLDDWCGTKYREEIREVSRLLDDKLRGKMLETEQEVRGAMVKQTAWMANEVYTLDTAKYQNDRVVKICQKSPKQKEYYVGTLGVNTQLNDTARIQIKKISAEDLTALSQKISEHVDGPFASEFDTELLCNGNRADSCQYDQLICGINYKNTDDRQDNLFKNQQNASLPSALDNYKKSLKGAPFSHKRHQKAVQKRLIAKVDKLLKMLTIKERMDKTLVNNLSIDLLKKLTNMEY